MLLPRVLSSFRTSSPLICGMVTSSKLQGQNFRPDFLQKNFRACVNLCNESACGASLNRFCHLRSATSSNNRGSLPLVAEKITASFMPPPSV